MMKSKTQKNPIKIPKATADDKPATRRMLKLVRNELKAEIVTQVKRVELGLSEVKQVVHQTKVLVEEQNANNRIVLEGLQAVWQRQERLE